MGLAEGTPDEFLSQSPPPPFYLDPASLPAMALASRNESSIISNDDFSINLALAEPVVFLSQLPPNGGQDVKSKIVGGYLRLQVKKPTELSRIDLTFKGISHTVSNGTHATKELRKHIWPLLHTNAFFEAPFFGIGAHSQSLANEERDIANIHSGTAKRQHSSLSFLQRIASLKDYNKETSSFFKYQPSTAYHAVAGKRRRMQVLTAQEDKGFKIFQPGEYLYDFEHLVDAWYPPTMDIRTNSVKWLFEVLLESPDFPLSPTQGNLEIPLVRVPSEEQLAFSEPAIITENVLNQYEFQLSVADKISTMGSDMPIHLIFTPKAHVTCHCLEVSIIEKTSRKITENHVFDVEPLKRVQLLKKYPGSTNLRSIESPVSRNSEADWREPIGTPLEAKLTIQIPNLEHRAQRNGRTALHFDSMYENLQISHKIGVMITANGLDRASSHHGFFRKYVELPVTILSPLAASSSIFLPEYTSTESNSSQIPRDGPCDDNHTIQHFSETMSIALLQPKPAHFSNEPNTGDRFENISVPSNKRDC